MRCCVIGVEGLIGCGKTTLVTDLAKVLDELMLAKGIKNKKTLTLFEPTPENGGNPYLDRYYVDPKRWSYTMQTHLLAKRFRYHKRAQWYAAEGAGCAAVDRTFYGDCSFANVQHEYGYMDDDEYDSYATLYDGMTASVKYPAVCLHILADPDTCNRRIRERQEKLEGRKCEKAIDLDYLRKLDKQISKTVEVLRQQGTRIFEVSYEYDRKTPEDRIDLVRGIAARILDLEPPSFLDLHRRIW